MKANEAPEKIYIDDPTGEFNDHWSVYPNEDSVEYICKDAFIKKACDWLKEIFSDYENLTDYNPTEDFKNYMKGE